MTKKRGPLTLLKKTFAEFSHAECATLAASLSYYTVFSLAPMLVVIIAVSSLFLGQEAVTGALFAQIRGLLGDQAAATLQGMLKNAYHPKESVLATVIGVVVLAFGSTGVFAQLQRCLNKIWGVHAKPREKKQWLKQIQTRFISFGMLLGIGFLLLVSLAMSAALAGLWGYVAGLAPGLSEVLLKGLEIAVSFLLTGVLFTMMFKFLPDIRIAWGSVWKGGFLTALLFEIGKNLIGLYLGRSNVASTYGAAGAIVIIMLWVYYSTLILFFGASFTKAYTSLHGRRAVTEEFAEKQDSHTPVKQKKAA